MRTPTGRPSVSRPSRSIPGGGTRGTFTSATTPSLPDDEGRGEARFTFGILFGVGIGAGKRGRFSLADPLSTTRASRPVPTPPSPPKFPTPPVPKPPPTSFPGGPAANDPKFGIGSILLRRGLILIGAVLTAKDILEMAESERELEDIRRRQADVEAERKIIRRRRDFGRDVRTIDNPAIPDIVVNPTPFPGTPSIPRTVPTPDAPPVETPEIVVLPQPIPLPSPGPVAVPRPPPRRAPAPRPGIRFNPFLVPLFSPTPSPRFVGRPAPLPFSPPAPNVPRLTPFNPSPVGFIDPISTPEPQPQPDQAERCQEVQRRRRKKGKCREGFFVETPTSTRYITWRERECDTVPGRKRKRFIPRVVI